jgi:hypothetical protein
MLDVRVSAQAGKARALHIPPVAFTSRTARRSDERGNARILPA